MKQQINIDICPTVDKNGAERCLAALKWFLEDNPDYELVYSKEIGDVGLQTILALKYVGYPTE